MKVLVLYAYHETPHSKVNLEFFNRFGLYQTGINQLLPSGSQTEDVSYCLIVNGRFCTVPLSERWTKTIDRDNLGYDFNAWYEGLQAFDGGKEFTHFIFMNDTVMGPFGDRHWIKTFTDLLSDEVKLAGISINCHVDLYAKHHGRASVPHVQSMFLCLDRAGLELIFPRIINSEILGKEETVIKKELGLSLAILNAGYNISCILPKYQVDFRKEENQFINSDNKYHGDPQFRGAYFGRSLHPLETIFFKSNRGINEKGLQEMVAVQNQMKFY